MGHILFDIVFKDIVWRLGTVKGSHFSENIHLFRRIITHAESQNFLFFLKIKEHLSGLFDRRQWI